MAENERMLAEINLTGCPVGIVHDKTDSDQQIEEQFFARWENALVAPPRWNMPSHYRVVKDDGVETLEHTTKSDRCLVTGDSLWGNYVVEAQIRQLNAFTQPSNDDQHGMIARSGIMIRYQDLRRARVNTH